MQWRDTEEREKEEDDFFLLLLFFFFGALVPISMPLTTPNTRRGGSHPIIKTKLNSTVIPPLSLFSPLCYEFHHCFLPQGARLLVRSRIEKLRERKKAELIGRPLRQWLLSILKHAYNWRPRGRRKKSVSPFFVIVFWGINNWFSSELRHPAWGSETMVWKNQGSLSQLYE